MSVKDIQILELRDSDLKSHLVEKIIKIIKSKSGMTHLQFFVLYVNTKRGGKREN